MDPEIKKLLYETHELAEENNKMLRKVRGVQKRQAFLSFLHWFLIIGVAIGAFYFLQPYISKVRAFFGDVSSAVEKVKDIAPN